MDDIDRTFLKLKRPDFVTMREMLAEETKRNHSPYIIFPSGFDMGVIRVLHPFLEQHGWTAEEFNAELNRIP
jgi:hypothetical protein